MSELQKFLFEGLPVRGALVQLTDVWQEILSRHQEGHTAQEKDDGPNPFLQPAVSELMGEISAAAVLLRSSVKFNGTLIMQIQGDGPLKLAVAEVQSDMGVRATAQIAKGEELPAVGGVDVLCNAHGQGRCAITLDPQDRQPGQQPYQGIVSLADESGKPLPHLSQVIEGYMHQSEQLPTCVILAADEHRAVGLLVQRLPLEGENNLGESLDAAQREEMDEHFNRIALLAKSLKREELLTLDVQEILHRLFWQEDIRLFEKQIPYFHCSCSRERVTQMLRSLGRAEIDSIVSEQGQVEVGCDFCNAVYLFDPVDASQLFVPDDKQPPGSEVLQ